MSNRLVATSHERTIRPAHHTRQTQDPARHGARRITGEDRLRRTGTLTASAAGTANHRPGQWSNSSRSNPLGSTFDLNSVGVSFPKSPRGARSGALRITGETESVTDEPDLAVRRHLSMASPLSGILHVVGSSKPWLRWPR